MLREREKAPPQIGKRRGVKRRTPTPSSLPSPGTALLALLRLEAALCAKAQALSQPPHSAGAVERHIVPKVQHFLDELQKSGLVNLRLDRR